MSGKEPMHEVFISYSTKDKTWGDAACAVLEANKVRCWIAPRDITPGTEWGAGIISGIDTCKIMVLIFSANANDSPQVRREVELAISKGMPVIPCRVEDVQPVGAMKYALSNTHWLDAFTPPVERQMTILAESVQALLGRPVKSASAKPFQGRGTHERTLPRQLRNWRVAAAIVASVLLVSALVAGIARTFNTKSGTKDDIAAANVDKQLAEVLVGGKNLPLLPLNRRASIASGRWRVEGDQLIQEDATMPYPDIYFGEFDWTDYDFSVHAKRFGGNDFFAVYCRWFDRNAYKFQVGSFGGRQAQLYRMDQADWSEVKKVPFPLRNNILYKTVLKARGNGYTAVVNGQVITEYVDPRHIGRQGRVALGTNSAACRFTKIEVRSRTGKLLWTGPPDIDVPKPMAGDQPAAVGLEPLEPTVVAGLPTGPPAAPNQGVSELAAPTRMLLPGAVLVGVNENDNGRSSPFRLEITERTGDNFKGIGSGDGGGHGMRSVALAGTVRASDVAYEFGNELAKQDKTPSNFANRVAFAGTFERGLLEGRFSTPDGKRLGVQKLNLAAVYTGTYQFVAGGGPKGKLRIEITQRQQNHFKGTLTYDDGPTTWVITGTVGKDDVQWQYGDMVSKYGGDCEKLTNNCRFTGTCKDGIVQGNFATLDNTQTGSLQATQLSDRQSGADSSEKKGK